MVLATLALVQMVFMLVCLVRQQNQQITIMNCLLIMLVETNHIEEKRGKYRITEKGSRNVAEVGSSLPYSVRTKASRITAPIAEKMRRAAMITAEHTVSESGACSVTLALSDGIGKILSLELLAADPQQAERMEHYFKNNAEDVYHDLIRMLTEDGISK